jgi:hypothetical protein
MIRMREELNRRDQQEFVNGLLAVGTLGLGFYGLMKLLFGGEKPDSADEGDQS